MAKISETELRRKLKKGGAGSGGTSGPSATKVGSTWEYSEAVLYLAYASALTGVSSAGLITNQSDATDFQFSPFNSAGTLLTWRGSLFSKSMYASGDATDYIWEDITVYSGSVSFVRYYTESSEIKSNIGDPDGSPAGITWTSIAPAAAIPGSAFWIAEQYTMNGIESDWAINQVKTKSAGFGLVSWTKSPATVKPALNSTQWNDDTLLAVGAFTGETYSNITEIGYGTAVVITYSDGKLYGLLKNVSGTATWVTPSNFIDGDLVVDGTINTDQITANAIVTGKIATSAITSNEIATGAVTATKVNLTPGDVGAGSSSVSGQRMNITSSKIRIYDSAGNLRVTLGDLS
jgi:hypothetical protein